MPRQLTPKAVVRKVVWKRPLDKGEEIFYDDDKLLKFLKKLVRNHPKNLPNYFLKVKIEVIP